MSRLVFAALTDWPYPAVDIITAPFRAKWTETRELLMREVDMLGADTAVVELDLADGNLRQDGEIRANARPRTGRVRLSVDSRHGPLQYACDRYDGNHFHGLYAWHANARAIALTLQSLRAVDRYGAVRAGEQYRGFAALPAGPAGTFSSADEALRWLDPDNTFPSVRAAYRAAARLLHPDACGDPTEWARLDEARRLLDEAGMLGATAGAAT